jgi:hypothetical protein
MNRNHGILLGLLAGQLALAVATWSGSGREAGAAAGLTPVFEFAAEDITAIRIVGESKADGSPSDSVSMVRRDDTWIIASAGDYPAATDKVDVLLEALADMKAGRAIASRRANHEALGVGVRSYGRRVTVQAGEEEHELILGRGVRHSSHMRLDDGDEVSVTKDVGVWNVRADARNYVEIAYVEVDRQQARSISIRNEHGSLHFSKTDAGWSLAELPPGAEQDSAAVGGLINLATRVSLHAPVGAEIDPEYGLADGAEVIIGWTTEDESSSSVRYVVGAQADDRSYYAKADDRGHVVTMAKHAAEQILSKTVADFVKAPATP